MVRRDFECTFSFADEEIDTIMKQIAKATFDGIVLRALQLQEERATQIGRGIKPYWYTAAVRSLVGLQYEPSQSTKLKVQSIDRVSRLYYKMLSLLEEPTERSLAHEVSLFLAHDGAETLTKEKILLGETTPPSGSVATASITLPEPISAESFTDAGLRLDAFDYGSASEWMLDDFWFIDDVPPSI